MAYVSSGTTISVDWSGVWLELGDVTSINLDGITVAELDTGNISTAVKSFVTGTKDNGTISLSLNFWPSVGSVSEAPYYFRPALYKSGAASRAFKIRFGGVGAGSTAEFNGYVTTLNVNASVDSVVTADVTIRIDGAITWTG